MLQKKRVLNNGGSWSWTEGDRADAAIADRHPWIRHSGGGAGLPGKLPNCDRFSMTVHMGVPVRWR